jgi:choline dehydrogenase-like flavoprotein
VCSARGLQRCLAVHRFVRSGEAAEVGEPPAVRAREAHEGADGPADISRQRSPRRSTAFRLEAARQCGYFIDRPNKPEPEGFSETVVTQRRGARLSTADAYLRPARRKNLKLITEATATRVVFDGPRAVEVEFEKDGERRVVRARREVVLSAGAVNSPQLLMLPGSATNSSYSATGSTWSTIRQRSVKICAITSSRCSASMSEPIASSRPANSRSSSTI